MSSESSICSSVRRPTPFIPLVSCPDCGAEVKQLRSDSRQHDGWIYYKCKTHGMGCNLYHWELEYVMYLVAKNYLQGDRANEAFGWAAARREKLELKKKESAGTGQEEMLMKSMSSVSEQLKEAVLLLKLLVMLMVVGVVLLLQNK